MLIENSVLIVVLWERDVLHAFNLFPGQRFVLGQAPGAWPFPVELLGARSVTLVDYASELPRWCPTGRTLESGQRASADFGRIRILASAQQGGCTNESTCPPPLLDRSIMYFVASAVAWTLALLASCYSVPLLAQTESWPIVRELALDLRDIQNTDAEPEANEAPPDAAGAVLPTIHAMQGTNNKGNADMGTTRSRRGARYGVQGPRDNPDPHISRPVPGLQSAEIAPIGLVNGSWSEDALAPQRSWGRDTALGIDDLSARGNTRGNDIDTAAGDEESDINVDGGQIKAIDVERAASVACPPRVIHTQLKVDGPLPAAAIEQALVSKLESIRSCYRADPASTGDHEGRIDVKIRIDSEGKANLSDTLRADNVAPTTTACILDKISTSTFSVASSTTEVVYPLFLIPSETLPSHAIARLNLAPPIVRSSERKTRWMRE